MNGDDELIEEMRVVERWYSMCPRRFHDATMENVDQPESSGELRRWLAEAREGSGTNLLVFGPVGSGKTFAAHALARELHFAGFGVVLTDEAELFVTAVRATTEVALACAAPVLVVDDLGVYPLTPEARLRMRWLLGRRAAHGRPTIATFAVEHALAPYQFGERAWDRLALDAVIVAFQGSSRRRTP